MKKHAAIVIEKDGEVLFVKRSMKKKNLPGAWSFPSGTIEEGETAVREAREELGVEVAIEKILTEVELPELSAKLFFVLCSIAKGISSICEPDEIDKIEWMSFKDFFAKFSDDEIGHGLIWLRKNPEVWKGL